jgi:hypothetical protein
MQMEKTESPVNEAKKHVREAATPYLPQPTGFEPVAKQTLMPDPWISMSVFRRMLEGIPSVEKLMARTHDKGLRIWIIVNNSTEDIRYQIYDKEWQLMQRFPGLGVAFDLIDREDRPLEQLVTFQDMDIQLTFRESIHAI